jgi:hypothetical protein
MPREVDLSSVNFRINVAFLVATDLSALLLVLKIKGTVKQADGSELSIVDYDTQVEYQFKDGLHPFVVGENINLPKPVLGNLISMGVATARGVFAAKTNRSDFEGLVIPMFTLDPLIPKSPLQIPTGTEELVAPGKL